MNLRLNNLSLVPPEPVGGFFYADGREASRMGHWWYYVAETDVWVFGGSYANLIEAVRLHLLTNKLPVPADLDGTVQEFICSMTPHNWKNGCVMNDAQGSTMAATWPLVKRWLRTMAALVKDGTLVSQEEAEARARTCLNCRYRVPITGCKGCGKSLGGLVTALLIGRSTPIDDQLSACGVCGCANRAMVHFANDTLDKGSGGLSYPSDTDGRETPCWRNSVAIKS